MVEGRQRSGAEMAPKHRWYGPAKAGVNAAGRAMQWCDKAQSTEDREAGVAMSRRSAHTDRSCVAPDRTRRPPAVPRSHRRALASWGQRWGRAVDEWGTTAAGAIDRLGLGTTMASVPSRILMATWPVSSADRCSSTCPQDLWLFRISLFLHPFKPIAWGQGKRHESLAPGSDVKSHRRDFPFIHSLIHLSTA